MKIKILPTLNSKPTFPDFGSIIRQAREDCGLSQQELAVEIVKSSAAAICLIESGKRGVSARDLYHILYVTSAIVLH